MNKHARHAWDTARLHAAEQARTMDGVFAHLRVCGRPAAHCGRAALRRTALSSIWTAKCRGGIPALPQ